MKILAVCGSGLGSSLMLSMNVQDVLKAMGKTDVEVEHTDFSSAAGMNADYIVCGKDIAEAMRDQSKVIALDSILSKQELREKLEAIF
ncbi:MAG: PTS sugar transporter subunit IIB [Oscillospiraceae bacterium]|nr:PTS sugar transporter subunit IIB [Oscillospiraceae bacterium]